MKILLGAYTGLGNFILKTPLIRAIHVNFPNSQIDLLCGSPWGAEQVLNGSNFIRKIHWCSDSSSLRSKIKTLLQLRQERYDVLFLPFDATPLYLQIGASLLGVKRVISHIYFGLMRRKFACQLTIGMMSEPKFDWVPVLVGRHECDLNLDLLEPLLTLPVERDLTTFVFWRQEDMTAFCLPENYLVIQPSARNGAATSKIWDPQRFSEVIAILGDILPNLKVVLVGDGGDADALAQTQLLNSRVINLLGKTTFNQLCNVLNRAELVLAHDSGVMHIANALNRPLLALYGPTDHTRTKPLGPNSRVLHSRTDCWAKMYGFRQGEVDLAERFPGYYCMSGISVDQVVSSIKYILRNNLL